MVMMIAGNVSRPIPIRPKARRPYDDGSVTLPDISIGEQSTAVRLPFPRLDEALNDNRNGARLSSSPLVGGVGGGVMGMDGLSQTASKSWESVQTLDSCGDGSLNTIPPVRNVLVKIPDDMNSAPADPWVMSYEDSISTEHSKKPLDNFDYSLTWKGLTSPPVRTRPNAPTELPSYGTTARPTTHEDNAPLPKLSPLQIIPRQEVDHVPISLPQQEQNDTKSHKHHPQQQQQQQQQLPLRAERKLIQSQSLTSARYYGECYLDGIGPLEADDAMRDSQVAFEKWWTITNSGAVHQDPSQQHDKKNTNLSPTARTTTTITADGAIHGGDAQILPKALLLHYHHQGTGNAEVDTVGNANNLGPSTTTTRKGDLTRVAWRYEIRHDESGETRQQKSNHFSSSSLSFNCPSSPPCSLIDSQKGTPESPMQFPFANLNNDSSLMNKTETVTTTPPSPPPTYSQQLFNMEDFSSSDGSTSIEEINENSLSSLDQFFFDPAANPSPKTSGPTVNCASALAPLLEPNQQPFQEVDSLSNADANVAPTSDHSVLSVFRSSVPITIPDSSLVDDAGMKTKPIPIPGSQQTTTNLILTRDDGSKTQTSSDLPRSPLDLGSEPVLISQNGADSGTSNTALRKRAFFATTSSDLTVKNEKEDGTTTTTRRARCCRLRSGCGSSCSSSSCGDRSTTSEVVLDLVEVDRRRLAAKAYRNRRHLQTDANEEDMPESSASSSSSAEEDAAILSGSSRDTRSRVSQSSGERTVKVSNRLNERESKLLEDVQTGDDLPSSYSSPSFSRVEDHKSDVSSSSNETSDKNSEGAIVENDKKTDTARPSNLNTSILSHSPDHHIITNVKTALLHELAISSGDVTTDGFLRCLDDLRSLYHGSGWDARDPEIIGQDDANMSRCLEGMWLTVSRPNYQECIGQNSNAEYMYTLGRMSFDMFQPTDLVCSLQGLFNPIRVVDGQDRDEVECVPKTLQEEIGEGYSKLRTYNIVTAFTIEPGSTQFGNDSPNATVARPIRGVMTTYGYILPDPDMPNRLSVWFSGGTIEVNDDKSDLSEWKDVFDVKQSRTLKQKAFVLAAQMLMGAEIPDGLNDDGSMSYYLRRPIGGHGKTYVDVIYLDDTLRIMQGHHGTIYVFARVPSIPDS